MLHDLLESPLVKRDRTCESCGDDFSCQVGLKGCWCVQVDLTDEAREKLAETFSDCLCQTCLEKAASLEPHND